jgi:hypothetical protein
MDEQLRKLKKTIELMRKQGVLHLKQGDLEINLSQDALLEPAKSTPSTASSSSDLQEEEDPNDTLLWSAPGLEANETISHG